MLPGRTGAHACQRRYAISCLPSSLANMFRGFRQHGAPVTSGCWWALLPFCPAACHTLGRRTTLLRGAVAWNGVNAVAVRLRGTATRWRASPLCLPQAAPPLSLLWIYSAVQPALLRWKTRHCASRGVVGEPPSSWRWALAGESSIRSASRSCCQRRDGGRKRDCRGWDAEPRCLWLRHHA